MYYRISKKPCGNSTKGFYYKRTLVDPLTRRKVGEPRRFSLGTKKEKEANERLKHERQRLLNLGTNDQSQILWPDFKSKFETIEEARVRYGKIQQSTHVANMAYLHRFTAFLKAEFGTEIVRIGLITTDRAQRFLDTITGKLPGQDGGRARQYARNSLIRAFQYAASHLQLPVNPFLNTSKFPVEHKKPNPFSVSELSEIISKLPEDTYELRTAKNGVRFAYGTGLRNSELRNLRLNQIMMDSEGYYLFLPRTKNGNEHRVPIENDALTAMLDQKKNLTDQFRSKLALDCPLFAGDKGTVLVSATVSKWMTKAIRRHAPHLKGKTWHTIRKTNVTEVTRTSGIEVASRVVNHSSTKVTERYYLGVDPSDMSAMRKALHSMPPLSNHLEVATEEPVAGTLSLDQVSIVELLEELTRRQKLLEPINHFLNQ